MNAILEDFFDDFFVSPTRNVFESLDFLFDFLTIDGAVGSGCGVTNYGEFSTVVDAKDGLHEMGKGMIVEVRRDVSNSESSQAGRICKFVYLWTRGRWGWVY